MNSAAFVHYLPVLSTLDMGQAGPLSSAPFLPASLTPGRAPGSVWQDYKKKENIFGAGGARGIKAH